MGFSPRTWSRRFGVGAAAVTAAVAVGIPVATAVTVGSGGMFHAGPASEGPTQRCTVNSVHEAPDGKKYMVTAGHCGQDQNQQNLNEGTVFDPATGEEYGRFVVTKNDFGSEGQDIYLKDYAVVELDDDTELRPGVSSSVSMLPFIPASPNLPLDHISTTKPGDIVYKDGATSGRTPGVTLYESDNYYVVATVGLPGDSGGVLHDGKGGNVAITSRSVVWLPLTFWQRSDTAFDEIQQADGYDLGGDTPTSSTGAASDGLPTDEQVLQDVTSDVAAGAQQFVDNTVTQATSAIPDVPAAPQAITADAQAITADAQATVDSAVDQVQSAVADAQPQFQDAAVNVENQFNSAVSQFLP